MNLKHFAFALTLPMLVGAGAAFSSDTAPTAEIAPASDVNARFHASLQDADGVRAAQDVCQQPVCARNGLLHYQPLDAAQTHGLLEQLQLTGKVADSIWGDARPWPVELTLTFVRGEHVLATYRLYQTPDSSWIVEDNTKTRAPIRLLDPQQEKSLRAYLDEVLPRHIHPK